MKHYNIACLGGGTGQAVILKSLKKYSNLKLSAIVTVTDSGRNSGTLRKELSILPPGDIRSCITALSPDNSILKNLFKYRFPEGKTLKGMNLGNLLIAAACAIKGNFNKGLIQICQVLNTKGEIIPASLQNIELCAELENGKKLKGEINVRKIKKESIKRVFLDKKNVKATPAAIRAIKKADFIIICPGSLYTSVISNLLIEEIKKAIAVSPAKKIFIANLLTQPGQTTGCSGKKHLAELLKYLGENVLNYAIINNKNLNKKMAEQYQARGVNLLKINFAEIKKTNIIPLYAPLLSTRQAKKAEWEKDNLLQHDIKKIGEVLYNLIRQKKSKRE